MQEQFNDMDSFRCLAHYGVLGMKWGVRRFQNTDGTLKAAGKGRYDGEPMSKSQLGKVQKKYSARSIQRQLNRNDKRLAKYKQDVAIAKVKNAKASLGFNQKRIDRTKQKLDKAQKRLDDGQKKTNDLIKQASDNGYTLKSQQVIRYTTKGRQTMNALAKKNGLSNYIIGKGNAASSNTYLLDRMRYKKAKRNMEYAKLYDENYSGMIKGQKYRVRK